MLRSIDNIIGYPLRATDGSIGKVKDMLISDDGWYLRYILAETGTWLAANRTLISPLHLNQPDLGRSQKELPVNLTKEQIENCPPLESDAPVSRRYETLYAKYHNISMYWAGPHAWGGTTLPEYAVTPLAVQHEPIEENEIENIERCHLRSYKELKGYAIDSTDDEFGQVSDMIIDDKTWQIRYLVVDTRKWLPGTKYLVDIQWLESVDWSSKNAKVSLRRSQIESAPTFDPTVPVNRDYLDNLYDYYGKPRPEHSTTII